MRTEGMMDQPTPRPPPLRFCVEHNALEAMCTRSPVRLVEGDVVGVIMELYVSARDATCRRIAVLNPKDGRVHHVDLVPGGVEYL